MECLWCDWFLYCYPDWDHRGTKSCYITQEIVMPKVNGRHFSYTKAGKKAAKRYAKKIGKKVMRKKRR